jgi:CDP-diglyceride synthetase
MLTVKILVLLVVANGAPIIANKLLGKRLNRPIDGGLILKDGRALFGPSKTVRGIAASLLATMIAAKMMGFSLAIGALIGSCAMLGDLVSSFVKRRLDVEPSGKTLGVDQIPEALIPVLVLLIPLDLTVGDIIVIVGSFFILELLLSRILHRIGVRERPY